MHSRVSAALANVDSFFGMRQPLSSAAISLISNPEQRQRYPELQAGEKDQT